MIHIKKPINILPYKKGYTFIGWTGSNGDSPEFEVVIPDGNTETLTYKANWSLNTYSISYEMNGGTNNQSNPTSYTVLDSTITLVTPTRDYYDFKGWKNGNNTITKIYTSNVQNYVLVASWTPHNYTITYDLGGGTNNLSNPISHTVESNDIVLAEPARDGYTFIGWTGSNGDVPSLYVTIASGNTNNLSYKANWMLNSYSITYVLYGGTNAIKNPSSYTIEDTITLKDATKDFYTFDGWYQESEFINKVENLNEMCGNLTLYANFVPYNYLGIFDNESYELSSEITLCWWEGNVETFNIKKGDIIDLYSFTTPNREGYVFVGWYKDSGLDNQVLSNESICGSRTLYAKWEKIADTTNSYTDLSTGIKFTRWIGIGVPTYNSGPQYFKVPYNLSGNCSVYVYSYLGNASGAATAIIDDLTSGTNVLTQKNMNGSKTLELTLTPGHLYKLYSSQSYSYSSSASQHWSEASITIKTVESNSLELVGGNEAEQQYENAAFKPTDPIRDGYDFLGWYDENNELIHDLWDYTSDKEFHTEWTIHNYMINYILNGGTNNTINQSTYNLNDEFTLANPTRMGYTFDGWYQDELFKTRIEIIHGTDYKDYTLYAKWIANNYVVTLDYKDGQNCPTVDFYSQGNLIRSVDLYKNSVLSYYVPDSPNENLKFAGWYTDSLYKNLYSFNETVNYNLKLYAKWIDIMGYKYYDLGDSFNVQINGNKYEYIAFSSLTEQTITVSSLSGLDLYGTIYNDNWVEIISNDDISDTNLDFSISVNVQPGKVYYLGYKANQVSTVGSCTITLNGSNSCNDYITGDYTQVIESISVTFDSKFELPVPKKEGCVFEGWFDIDGKQIDENCWSYTDNITIYAYWKTK